MKWAVRGFSGLGVVSGREGTGWGSSACVTDSCELFSVNAMTDSCELFSLNAMC